MMSSRSMAVTLGVLGAVAGHLQLGLSPSLQKLHKYLAALQNAMQLGIGFVVIPPCVRSQDAFAFCP
jgi:hypothetical protein